MKALEEHYLDTMEILNKDYEYNFELQTTLLKSHILKCPDLIETYMKESKQYSWFHARNHIFKMADYITALMLCLFSMEHERNEGTSVVINSCCLYIRSFADKHMPKNPF